MAFSMVQMNNKLHLERDITNNACPLTGRSVRNTLNFCTPPTKSLPIDFFNRRLSCTCPDI